MTLRIRQKRLTDNKEVLQKLSSVAPLYFGLTAPTLTRPHVGMRIGRWLLALSNCFTRRRSTPNISPVARQSALGVIHNAVLKKIVLKKGSSCIVVGEEPFRQIKSLIEIGPGRFGKGISIAEQNSNT